MSIEERLYALAQQYGAEYGPTALANPAQLVPQLSSKAPDLHGEIRALAAAIQANAAGRIAAAPNGDLEAQAIAAEIAASQKLSMASAGPAVAVARRLGAVPAAATAGGWAGDSVAVGAVPQPYALPAAPHFQPQPPYAPQPMAPSEAAPPPYWQNKWVLGSLGVVLLALGYQQMNKQPGTGPAPAPTPVSTNGPNIPPGPDASPVPDGPTVPDGTNLQDGPTPPDGRTQPPVTAGQGEQFPALQPPNGQLPRMSVQNGAEGIAIGFSIPSKVGPIAGTVALPPGGWDSGEGAIAFTRKPGTNQTEAIGKARFQRIQSGANPVRVAQIGWINDSIGMGDICVAFIGNGGQDVKLQGAKMCVMDGACNRASACGVMP